MKDQRPLSGSDSPFDSPLEVRPLNEPPGIEPELLRPVPRLVRSTNRNIQGRINGFLAAMPLLGALSQRWYPSHIGFLVTWAWAVIAALFWLYFSIERRRQHTLITSGLAVRARVEDKGAIKNKRSLSYWIEFSFCPLEPALRIRQRAYVGLSLWNRTAKDEELTVLYNPRRPKQNVIYQAALFRAL